MQNISSNVTCAHTGYLYSFYVDIVITLKLKCHIKQVSFLHFLPLASVLQDYIMQLIPLEIILNIAKLD